LRVAEFPHGLCCGRLLHGLGEVLVAT
jgi:hypothetical protein